MELKDQDIETPEEPSLTRDDFAPRHRNRSLALKAAGGLLLIILLFVFLGIGGGDEDAARELNAFKSRLDGLEEHLARVEAVEQKLSSSEKEIMELQATVISLEMATRNLEMLTSGMKARTEKPVHPAPPKPQAQQARPQPTSMDKRFHEVRRGETLFSIGKKHGLTADELRSLNHLSENFIQPGQRLRLEK